MSYEHEIALFAGLIGSELRNKFNNNSNSTYTSKGGDWRRHLKQFPQANQQHSAHAVNIPPQHQPLPHPPQQAIPHQYEDIGPDVYQVEPTSPNLLPIPFAKDEKGNPIYPPSAQALIQPDQTHNITLTDVRGFQIPNYDKSKLNLDAANRDNNGRKIKHDHDDVFDLLLKEIKSLKKAVNKLTREFEKSKLPTENQSINNETTSNEDNS